MGKSYDVYGGSLTAAVLASQLALAGKKVRVFLPEEDVLVSGWKPCDFGGFKTNNGFHAIDLSRAPGLVHLLAVDLGFELTMDVRPAGLLIQGKLYNSEAEASDWGPQFAFPTGVQKGSVDQIDEDLDPDFRRFLQRISRRYGDSWEETKSLMIPWFLPANILLQSQDEGDRFRNLVRKGIAKPQRVFPATGVFGDLAREWLEKLVSMGVTVEVADHPKKLPAGSSSSPPRLRDFHLTLFSSGSELFDSFAETLVAWDQLPAVARISTIISVSPFRNVLLESYHSPGEVPEAEQWGETLARLASESFQLIGTDLTRTVHRAPVSPASPPFQIRDNGRRVSVKFAAQGPINMAKVYRNATLACQQLGIEA